jgi:predicted acetyltransferase
MNINLAPVRKEEKEILKNLLEKYFYEFSQYTKYDVNHLGLYGLSNFDFYWLEKNWFPYFIKAGEKLAGFVLMNDRPIIKTDTNYTIVEFFVMHKYRRQGAGRYVLETLFEKFKGKWQLLYHPDNNVSRIFWNKVIKEYTNNNFVLIKDNPEAKYEDGTIGEVIIFNT